jgi:hypothetical protein
MKTRVVVAFAAGAMITLFLALGDSQVPSRFWQYLMAPGGILIILIWGAHGGGGDSEFAASMVGIIGNIVAYAFIVLGLLALLDSAKRNRRSSTDV